MSTYTPEQITTELHKTGKDIRTGEPVFELETRPILYHQVVVSDKNGRREQRVTPICPTSNYGIDIFTTELRDGEKVIACIPAVAGSYCVYAYACTPKEHRLTEICLGAVLADDMNAFGQDTAETFHERKWMRCGALAAEIRGWCE